MSSCGVGRGDLPEARRVRISVRESARDLRKSVPTARRPGLFVGCLLFSSPLRLDLPDHPRICWRKKGSRPERSHGLQAPGGSAIICRRRAGAGQERGRFRLQSVWHSDKGRKPTSPPLTCPTATIVATVCAQRLAVYREPDKVSQPVPKTETSFRQYPAGSHPPRLTSLFSLLYSHFSSGTRATRNPSSLDRTAG